MCWSKISSDLKACCYIKQKHFAFKHMNIEHQIIIFPIPQYKLFLSKGLTDFHPQCLKETKNTTHEKEKELLNCLSFLLCSLPCGCSYAMPASSQMESTSPAIKGDTAGPVQDLLKLKPTLQCSSEPWSSISHTRNTRSTSIRQLEWNMNFPLTLLLLVQLKLQPAPLLLVIYHLAK